MAILENRLNTKQITDVTTQSYDSLTDSAIKEANKPLSIFGGNLNIKSLFMNNIPSRLRSPLEDLYGIFSDTICNGIVPLDLRLGSLKDRLLRNLALGIDLGIGCIGNLALLDQLMGRKPFSFLNFGYGLDFDLSKEALLNNLLSAQTASLLRSMNQNSNLANCGLDSMKGFLSNDLAFSGLSIKQKLDLLKALSSMGGCSPATTSYYAKKAISSATAAGAVTKLSSMGKTNALTSISNLASAQGYYVKSGTSLNSISEETIENRENLLTGFRKSLAVVSGENAELKLQMLSLFKKTDTLELKQKELIATLGIVSNVLKSLSDSAFRSESPTNDLNNIIEGLNNLDPNWNKDSTGQINYSEVSNNNRLVNLSNRVINTTPAINKELTGDVNTTTELSTEVLISVLNKVTVTNQTIKENNVTNPDIVELTLNNNSAIIENNPTLSNTVSTDKILDLQTTSIVTDPESVFDRINRPNTYENIIINNGLLNSLNTSLESNMLTVVTNTTSSKKLVMDNNTSITHCYVNSINQTVCCSKKECLQ